MKSRGDQISLLSGSPLPTIMFLICWPTGVVAPSVRRSPISSLESSPLSVSVWRLESLALSFWTAASWPGHADMRGRTRERERRRVVSRILRREGSQVLKRWTDLLMREGGFTR